MKKGVVRCLAASLSILLALEPLSAGVLEAPSVRPPQSTRCMLEAMSHASVHFRQPLEKSSVKSHMYQRVSSWFQRGGDAQHSIPWLKPLAYGVSGIAVGMGVYFYPPVLLWIGSGAAFAVLSAHIPQPSAVYKASLFEELDMLRHDQLPWDRAKISGEIYHNTMEMIRSAGDLSGLFEAWNAALMEEPHAFKKFLYIFFDSLAVSDYVAYLPALTRLTYKFAKLGVHTKPLFDLMMSMLGKKNAYSRRLSHQYKELTSRGNIQPLRVVYVAPEILPHTKKGGLATVTGEVPRAMNQYNAWVTSITLLYTAPHMLPAPREPRRPLMLNGQVVEIPVMMNNERGEEEIHIARVYKSGLPAAWLGSPEKYLLEDVTSPRPEDGVENLTVMPYDSRTPKTRAMQTRFLAEGSLLLTRFLVEQGEMPKPDFIIGHDWPAALVNVYLRTKYAQDPFLAGVEPGLFLHNIFKPYQGYLPQWTWPLLGLDEQHMHGFVYQEASLSHEGDIVLSGGRSGDADRSTALNLTAAALFHAGVIIPVSSVFADMIQDVEFGEGLHHILKIKADQGRLRGISNGMTYDSRNRLLKTPEDIQHFRDLKSIAKRALLEETGLWENIVREIDQRIRRENFQSDESYQAAVEAELAVEFARPVEVFLARLDAEQKGLGFYMDPHYGIEAMMRKPPALRCRFIMMGSPMRGESDPPTRIERYMKVMQAKHPSEVAFIPKFSVPLAHREKIRDLFISEPIMALEHLIWAGGDMTAIPSKMEPFGLTGLEALNAGVVVMGSTRGGPAVMVTDVRVDPEHANGILFGEIFGSGQEDLKRVSGPYTAEEFFKVREFLIEIYNQHPEQWDRLRLNAKNTRMTWDESALEQLKFLAERRGRQDIMANPAKPIHSAHEIKSSLSEPESPGLLLGLLGAPMLMAGVSAKSAILSALALGVAAMLATALWRWWQRERPSPPPSERPASLFSAAA